jgi:hypothetical protein
LGAWRGLLAARGLAQEGRPDTAARKERPNNLLGKNPAGSEYREQAETMKGLLVQWLEEAGSPHRSQVMKRDAVTAAN